MKNKYQEALDTITENINVNIVGVYESIDTLQELIDNYQKLVDYKNMLEEALMKNV